MRQFNRILGFVAVSFVLAFMGKVNKVGLYTVYFKTIADVEIRNSTAFDYGDAQYVIPGPSDEARRLAGHAGGSTALTATPSQAPQTFAVSFSLKIRNVADVPSMGLRCWTEVAPRAPGA